MEGFGQEFVQSMKSKLDVELIGMASVQDSPSVELKERVGALLPKAKSVVVLGKEIYKEVVSLLKPSQETGEAESGELLTGHSDYLNGLLTRAVHELATLFRQKGYGIPDHASGGALGPEVSNGPSVFQTCSGTGRSGYDWTP